MKVILRSDIVNIGRQGEIRDLAAGFARNYLIPKRLVMEASKANLKIWEKEKVKLEKEREKIINDAKALAAQVEKVSLTITVKVGDTGKLFGSVTSGDIAEGIEKNGFKISKTDILLPEAIKEVGAFTVNVRLHPEVFAAVKVWVVEDKQGKAQIIEEEIVEEKIEVAEEKTEKTEKAEEVIEEKEEKKEKKKKKKETE